MSIPQTFIDDLLSRADIVEVVGRHVPLKKAGANFVGLCPFHNEKSPSFSVSPVKQFYHCFGCGKSGNALGFMMEHSGMHFVDAVQDLAHSFGMVMPQTQFSPQDQERAVEKRRTQNSLIDILESAAAAYRQHLRDSPKAVAYLKQRGLSGEIAKTYGLGYALDEWTQLTRVFEDYQDPRLVESSLVIDHQEDPQSQKRYDRFRDRIMFPIRNIKGECIGFGGRVLGEGTPKYLNSSETPVFSKGRELYGLFEARQAIKEAAYAIVTEGYMDVVALAQLGFPQTVATLGTACTSDHVQKLFRHTDTIVFSFDGDAAGRRAAKKALEVSLAFAKDTRSLKFLFLPPEHDPDSFVREQGVDAFSRMIASATPLSQFLVEQARLGCELASAEGRSLLASQAFPLWSELPEGVLKAQILSDIALLVNLGPHELRNLWLQQATPAQGYSGSSGLSGQRGLGPAGAGNFANPNGVFKRAFSKTGKRWGFKSDGFAADHNTAPRGSLRHAPMSRQDRAVQILFQSMSGWAQLSTEQQNLLCHLPSPHGSAFTWLDQQLNEHGLMSWSTLCTLPMPDSWANWLVALIQNIPSDLETEASELISILLELEKADVSAQLTQMAPLVGNDPQIYQQFKSLSARFALLKAKVSV
jgi:DNA primase